MSFLQIWEYWINTDHVVTWREVRLDDGRVVTKLRLTEYEVVVPMTALEVAAILTS